MQSHVSPSKKNSPVKVIKELTIWEALIPVFALVAMLFYNVFIIVQHFKLWKCNISETTL